MVTRTGNRQHIQDLGRVEDTAERWKGSGWELGLEDNRAGAKVESFIAPQDKQRASVPCTWVYDCIRGRACRFVSLWMEASLWGTRMME